MKIKKIVFTVLSVFLLYSFFFLRANIKQDIQAETKKLFEVVKPMAFDLAKTNDALDILDDEEIEKLAKNIAAFARLIIPVIKQLPKDKKEPSVPAVKTPQEKVRIKKERASLLKSFGILYLCAGTLELNKKQADALIEKLSKEELNKLKKALTNLIQSLDSLKL